MGGFPFGRCAGGALRRRPFGRLAGSPFLRFMGGAFGGLPLGGFALGTLGRFTRGPLRRGPFRRFTRGAFRGLAGGLLGGGALGRFLQCPLGGARLALGQLAGLAFGRFTGGRLPQGALGALGGFPFGALRALGGFLGCPLGGGTDGRFLFGPGRGFQRRPLRGGALGRLLPGALGVGARLRSACSRAWRSAASRAAASCRACPAASRGGFLPRPFDRFALVGRGTRVALPGFLVATRLRGLLGRVALGLLPDPALGRFHRLPLQALAGLALRSLPGLGVADGALGGLPLGCFPRGAQRRFVRLPLGFLPRAPLDGFALGGGARLALGSGAIRRFPRHLFGGITCHLLRERASFALGLFARLGFLPCAFRRLASEAFTCRPGGRRPGWPRPHRPASARLFEHRAVAAPRSSPPAAPAGRRGGRSCGGRTSRLRPCGRCGRAARPSPRRAVRWPRSGPWRGHGAFTSIASAAAGGGSATARRRGAIVTCICISDSAESRSTEDVAAPAASVTAGVALAISSS